MTINDPDALPPTTAFGVIKGFVSRWMKPSMPQEPVLLVDDEEPVLRFVERVLRDAGYKTVVASSGREAIAIARQVGPVAGLVTDLMMPAMAGDELARLLRQSQPELKVLYLTGYSDRLFKEKTMLWAGEAFLEKPCSVKGLREAVSLLLFGSLAAAS
jgi:two-component system cell cycle sensor histidine kinase/response regulator CckA